MLGLTVQSLRWRSMQTRGLCSQLKIAAEGMIRLSKPLRVTGTLGCSASESVWIPLEDGSQKRVPSEKVRRPHLVLIYQNRPCKVLRGQLARLFQGTGLNRRVLSFKPKNASRWNNSEYMIGLPTLFHRPKET